MRKDVQELAPYFIDALNEHGVTPAGVLWPNAPDLATRYEVLLSPIDFQKYSPFGRVKLLDLGCGPGLLLDYLAENRLIDVVDYHGVDVLAATMEPGRGRWPLHRFELRDVRDNPFADAVFDFCIVCGTFTARF